MHPPDLEDRRQSAYQPPEPPSLPVQILAISASFLMREETSPQEQAVDC